MDSQPGADELVRSSQKDVYYLNWLKDIASDVSRGILGSRLWIKWQRELQILTELAYFGLSTLSGYQTLGEEYCYLIQVEDTRKSIPSFSRRLLMVLLSTLTPYLLEKLLSKLEKEIRSPELLRTLSEEDRRRLKLLIPVLKNLISLFQQIHTISFYFNGVFYHIAKRFTRIKHILVRETEKDQLASITYRILGWLSFIQLIISIIQWLPLYIRPSTSQSNHPLIPG
ncbi:Peroxisome biogenesis factor 10 [Trichoplax sp. H2]|nr:Peroxisome biogenesis factor 10 [Trichoplax sp. H2]|eukprot:RDD44076.1 Peroxisome biogenesis factor 10 [Trichoplax sp. H2]